MTTTPAPGPTIGSYELGALLGEGTFARVYRARHRVLGTQHAVKLLRAEYLDDVDAAGRFVDEARVQAQLHHPHIARVTEIVQLPGIIAIVLDHVAGGTLAADLAARSAPMGPEAARRLFLPLLDAVGHAHANGVVHRDIKPDNILLDAAGRPVLADFGIARIRGELAARTRAATMARRLGSGGYESPEQFRAPGAVDGRSDVFSLGVVLFELATLTHPFAHDSDFDTMQAAAQGAFVVPEGLRRADPALAAAITRALQPDPARRFQTCGEFAAALAAPTRPARRTVRDEPAATAVSGAPPARASRAAPPPRRIGPALAALAAAFVLIGITTLGVFLAVGTAGYGAGGSDLATPAATAAAAPAPATAAPAAPAATAAPAPAAVTWRGTLEEADFTLELTGAAAGPLVAVEGRSRVTAAAGTSTARVRGTFDPRTGRLLLDEAEPDELVAAVEAGRVAPGPALPEATLRATWSDGAFAGEWSRGGLRRAFRLAGPAPAP